MQHLIAKLSVATTLLMLPGCGDDDSTMDDDGAGTTTSDTASSTTEPDGSTTDPDSTATGTDTSADDTETGGSDDSSSDTTDGGLTDDDPTNDVFEIAVRRLDRGQDVAEFEAARDAFVAQLKLQPGVGTDREFEAFVDYATFTPPQPPVFIGMTQYDNIDAFAAAGEALGDSAEAGAFFSTFTPEAFTALVPLEAGAAIALADIADHDGHVLEVAVRDFSTYENFDMNAYEGARDGFLALLSQQPGFVAEYQWVSVLDANVAVGMTVYENAEAFTAIASDPAFNGSAEAAAFLGPFPPNLGYVNDVVK